MTRTRLPQGQAFPEPANQAVLRALRAAAAAQSTVTITYTDSKNQTTNRETEPYELRDGKYWGFDIVKGEIRQFQVSQIAQAVVTNTQYQPRWPIKIS